MSIAVGVLARVGRAPVRVGARDEQERRASSSATSAGSLGEGEVAQQLQARLAAGRLVAVLGADEQRRSAARATGRAPRRARRRRSRRGAAAGPPRCVPIRVRPRRAREPASTAARNACSSSKVVNEAPLRCLEAGGRAPPRAAAAAGRRAGARRGRRRGSAWILERRRTSKLALEQRETVLADAAEEIAPAVAEAERRRVGGPADGDDDQHLAPAGEGADAVGPGVDRLVVAPAKPRGAARAAPSASRISLSLGGGRRASAAGAGAEVDRAAVVGVDERAVLDLVAAVDVGDAGRRSA